MDIAVQLVIAGILQGGVYALAAFGLSLIFGVSDVLNLAHGEFLMLGGLFTFLLFNATGLNPFLIGLMILPFTFSLGYIFDRFLMRPLANKKKHIRLMSSILVTLGAALFIEDVTSFLTGAEEKGVDYTLPSFFWGDIYISYLRLLAMVMIAALTVGIHYYLKKTFTGRGNHPKYPRRHAGRRGYLPDTIDYLWHWFTSGQYCRGFLRRTAVHFSGYGPDGDD